MFLLPILALDFVCYNFLKINNCLTMFVKVRHIEA